MQKAIAKLEALLTLEAKERALAKSRQQPVQSFSLQNLTGVFAQLNATFQDDQQPTTAQMESFLLGLYMRRDFVWQKGVALKKQQDHKDQEFASMRQNVAGLLHQECAIVTFDVQSMHRQLQPYAEHTTRQQQLAETLQTQCGVIPEETAAQLKIFVSESQRELQTTKQNITNSRASNYTASAKASVITNGKDKLTRCRTATYADRRNVKGH